MSVRTLDRIPETWKPYFKIALGDPSKPQEKDFLIARSPKAHLHNMSAPMLVIQGRNDPRVVAAKNLYDIHKKIFRRR